MSGIVNGVTKSINLLGCTGLIWAVLECTGLHWDVLGRTGFYRAVQGCPKNEEKDFRYNEIFLQMGSPMVVQEVPADLIGKSISLKRGRLFPTSLTSFHCFLLDNVLFSSIIMIDIPKMY